MYVIWQVFGGSVEGGRWLLGLCNILFPACLEDVEFTFYCCDVHAIT